MRRHWLERRWAAARSRPGPSPTLGDRAVAREAVR